MIKSALVAVLFAIVATAVVAHNGHNHDAPAPAPSPAASVVPSIVVGFVAMLASAFAL